MLKEPIATPRRQIAGNAAVAVLVSVVAFTAWAAQPHVPGAQDSKTSNSGDVTKVVILGPPHQASKAAAKPWGDYVGKMEIPPPAYPKEALDAGISGKVTLIVDVAADGTVAGVKVESSEPAGVFDAAALASVKKWRFTPAMKNGKPVGGRVRVPIEWHKD